MSIPLYLAYDWKESVNNWIPPAAQLGFGFFADGSPRLPEQTLPDALTVIDDAVLPEKVLPAALERLAAHCRNGCLLDFERKPNAAHRAILLGLAGLLADVPLFAVPERFSALYPRALPFVTQPRQCASWSDFARRTQRQYPNGWMLEIFPCSYTAKMPFAKTQSGFLESAVCCYRQSGASIRYYDTMQTLRNKLEIAERHGCRAAVGLYCELSPLMSK